MADPTNAAFFPESDDGCEVSQSVVESTTGMGFFDDPYDIDAVVVRDRGWIDEDCTGEYVLAEDTFDWYAQDEDGNVWFMGENTTAWDDEENCLTTEVSWKAGDDEACRIPGARARRKLSFRFSDQPGCGSNIDQAAATIRVHRGRLMPHAREDAAELVVHQLVAEADMLSWFEHRERRSSIWCNSSKS